MHPTKIFNFASSTQKINNIIEIKAHFTIGGE